MTTSVPVLDRVMARVVKTTDCWLWTGKPNANGYGSIRVGGRGSKQRPVQAITWEAEFGAVPDGLELDHICRTRNCVRPDHLEAVTHEENLRRRPSHRTWVSVCKRGHKLAGSNVLLGYRASSGHERQRCRACAEIARTKYSNRL